jgi:hypothetical protein
MPVSTSTPEMHGGNFAHIGISDRSTARAWAERKPRQLHPQQDGPIPSGEARWLSIKSTLVIPCWNMLPQSRASLGNTGGEGSGKQNYALRSDKLASIRLCRLRLGSEDQ